MKDFGPSWRDGYAFNAMIHNIRPELVDMAELPHRPNKVNLENAFTRAEEHLGIPRLIDPEGKKINNVKHACVALLSFRVIYCFIPNITSLKI